MNSTPRFLLSLVHATIACSPVFKKAIAVVTAACFLATTVLCPTAHAVIATIPFEKPPYVENDNLIPYTAGRITDAKYYGSDTVVINIQDLHCHGEVQRNIARILESLDKNCGLSKVHVEGGIGAIDTSWASLIPDQQRRERVLSILLDSGKLSGAEYYAIRSGKNDLLAGLEDEKPYRENLSRLREITASRDRNAALLPGIRQRIAPLKERYFSQRNRRLEKLLEKREEGGSYYRLLVRSARKAGIDLYEYPAITDYLAVMTMQKRLNHKRVARELAACLSSLKSRLPYSVYSDLSRKTENFSRTDDLCVQLLVLTQERNIPVAAQFPALAKYFKLIDTIRRINPIELVREERQLVRELRSACTESGAEKEVVFMADYEDYLEDYFDGKIAADNYRYFTENSPHFISLWKKYVSVRDLPDIEPEHGLLRDFYRVNIDRNGYFLQNLFTAAPPVCGTQEYRDIDHQRKVLESLGSARIATMVIGGFHTPGFLSLLREKKISYLVITPSVTSDTSFSDKAYDRLAREQGETIPTQTIALASYSQELLKWRDAQQKGDADAILEALERLKIAKDTLEGRLQLALQETGGDPKAAEAAVNKASKDLGFDATLTYKGSDAARGDKYLFDYLYRDDGRSVRLELALDREKSDAPSKRMDISHVITAALAVLLPASVLTFLFLHGYIHPHFEPLTIATDLQASFITMAMMIAGETKSRYSSKDRAAALDSLLRQIQHPDDNFLARLDDLIDIGMIGRDEKAVLRKEIAGHPTEHNYRTVFVALKRLGADEVQIKDVAFQLLELNSQGAKVTGLRYLDGRKVNDVRMIQAAKELLKDPFSNFRVAGIITLERIGEAEEDVVDLILGQLGDPAMYPAVFSAVLTLEERGFSFTDGQQQLLADAVLDVLTPFVYGSKPWRTNTERDLIADVLPLTGMKKADQRLIDAYAAFATAPELSQDEDAQSRAVGALGSTRSAAATGPLLKFLGPGHPYTVINNSFYALFRLDRRNMQQYRVIALNSLGGIKNDLAREKAATATGDPRYAVLENKIAFIEKLMRGISNIQAKPRQTETPQGGATAQTARRGPRNSLKEHLLQSEFLILLSAFGSMALLIQGTAHAAAFTAAAGHGYGVVLPNLAAKLLDQPLFRIFAVLGMAKLGGGSLTDSLRNFGPGSDEGKVIRDRNDKPGRTVRKRIERPARLVNTEDPQKILQRAGTLAETGTEKDVPWLISQLEKTKIDAVPYAGQPEYIGTIFWALTKIKYRGAAVQDDPLLSHAALRMAERNTFPALSDQRRSFIERLMTPGMMTGELIQAFAVFSSLPGNKDARDIQLKAVRLLGLSGSPDAIKPLRGYLIPENNVSVVYEAYDALIQLAPGSAGRYLQDAVAVFNSSREYRKNAVNMLNTRIASIESKLKEDTANGAQLLQDKKQLEDILRTLESRPNAASAAAPDQNTAGNVQELIGKLQDKTIAALAPAEQPGYIASIFWSLIKLKMKGQSVPDHPLIASAALLLAKRYPSLTNGQREALYEILSPGLMSWELIDTLDASFVHDRYRDEADLQASFIRLLGKSGSTHAAEPLKKFFTRRNRVSIIYETYLALERVAPASASVYFDRAVDIFSAVPGDQYQRNAVNMFSDKLRAIDEKLKKSAEKKMNDREGLLSQKKLLEDFLEAIRGRQPGSGESSFRKAGRSFYKKLGVVFLSAGFASVFLIRLALGQPEAAATAQTDILAALQSDLSGIVVMMPFMLAMARKMKKKERLVSSEVAQLVADMPTGGRAFFVDLLSRWENEEFSKDEKDYIIRGLEANISETNYLDVFKVLDKIGRKKTLAAFSLLAKDSNEAKVAALTELYRQHIDDARMRSAETALLNAEGNQTYLEFFGRMGRDKDKLLTDEARRNIVEGIRMNLDTFNYKIIFDNYGDGILTQIKATDREKIDVGLAMLSVDWFGAKSTALQALEDVIVDRETQELLVTPEQLRTMLDTANYLLTTKMPSSGIRFIEKFGSVEDLGQLVSLLDDNRETRAVLLALTRMYKRRHLVLPSYDSVKNAIAGYTGHRLTDDYEIIFDLLFFTDYYPETLGDDSPQPFPGLHAWMLDAEYVSPNTAMFLLLKALPKTPKNRKIIGTMQELGRSRYLGPNFRNDAIAAIRGSVSTYNAAAVLPALKALGATERERTETSLALLHPETAEGTDEQEIESAIAVALRDLHLRQVNEFETPDEHEDVLAAAFKLLGSSHEGNRNIAITTLERIGDKSAIRPLQDTLKAPLPRTVRIHILKTLKHLLDPATGAVKLTARDDGELIDELAHTMVDNLNADTYKDILMILKPLPGAQAQLNAAYQLALQLPDEKVHLAAIDSLRITSDRKGAIEILKKFLSPDYTEKVIKEAYGLLKKKDTINKKLHTGRFEKLMRHFADTADTPGSVPEAVEESLRPAVLSPAAAAAARLSKDAGRIQEIAAVPELRGRSYFRFARTVTPELLDELDDLAEQEMETFIILPAHEYPQDAGEDLSARFGNAVMKYGDSVRYLNIRAVRKGHMRILLAGPADATQFDEQMFDTAAPFAAVAQMVHDNSRLREALGARTEGFTVDFVEADEGLYREGGALNDTVLEYPALAQALFFDSQPARYPAVDEEADAAAIKERAKKGFTKSVKDTLSSVFIFFELDPRLLTNIQKIAEELPADLREKLSFHKPTSSHVTLEEFKTRPGAAGKHIKTRIEEFLRDNQDLPQPSLTASGANIMSLGALFLEVFPGPSFRVFKAFTTALAEESSDKNMHDPHQFMPHVTWARIVKKLKPDEFTRFREFMENKLRTGNWGLQYASRLVVTIQNPDAPPEIIKYDLAPLAKNKASGSAAVPGDSVDDLEERFNENWKTNADLMSQNGITPPGDNDDLKITFSVTIEPYLLGLIQNDLRRGLPQDIRKKIKWNNLQQANFLVSEFAVAPENVKAVKAAIAGMDLDRLLDAGTRETRFRFKPGALFTANGTMRMPVYFDGNADVYGTLREALAKELSGLVSPVENDLFYTFAIGRVDEDLTPAELELLLLQLNKLLKEDWGSSAGIDLNAAMRSDEEYRHLRGQALAADSEAPAKAKQRPFDGSLREKDFSGVFTNDPLDERLQIMARARRLEETRSTYSTAGPLLSQTIDFRTFSGGLFRLGHTDYFKEQARIGNDTFVFSHLVFALHGIDKAKKQEYLELALQKAREAGVRIVFDYEVSRVKDAKSEILSLMKTGFDGYRLRYAGEEPSKMMDWLPELVNETYFYNADAVIALPFNGRRGSEKLEQLAAQYELYRLVLIDPENRQEGNVPEKAWVEMAPQKYEADEQGARKFKDDLAYAMEITGASVVGMDSSIFAQGEHRFFSGINDFMEFFIQLFNNRIEKRKEDPSFRYNNGRHEGLRLPAKSVPALSAEQRAQLLDLIINYRALAEKWTEEQRKREQLQSSGAPAPDAAENSELTAALNAAAEKLGALIPANISEAPQDDAYHRLRELHDDKDLKDVAAGTDKKLRVLASAAGFADGLLYQDVGQFTGQDIPLSSPRHAEIYRRMIVETQIAMRTYDLKETPRASDDSEVYKRFYKPLTQSIYESKRVGNKDVQQVLEKDAGEVGDIASTVRRKLDTPSGYEHITDADLADASIPVIEKLYTYARYGKPGTRPVAIAELLRILELYAEKKSIFDAERIKKNTRDMVPEILGIKAVESAA